MASGEPPKTGYAFFKSISPRGRILLGVLGMTFSILGMWLTDSRVNTLAQAEAAQKAKQK